MPINTQIPRAIVTRSFHFAIFTPFTRSHRQNDDSPINGGTRMAGIIKSANVGAKSAAEPVRPHDHPLQSATSLRP